ncbi:MAG TPA: hypothetical protein DEG17_09005 [Cyanobacteria bacterium UBA11149]|nr:hypothetical protein [Cyanobacteria bacterium UBA11367]HBE58358.1 hypothetical protein [Cyanobacteria bacterium UBA11366]HBK66836.1 hypothetical protein [Cyanobacteria bacterium UBA11166]HBR72827.1 hypothetical protein [Cyanobacteria bacterium UBA11159]HBS68220.1 hypothetical protein [Cyanobacteria bacterium UBA11153]HBW88992.1 hypothetical protein [Cyanobacteria bacterium UBA11149]HCA94993.1 hypothetical protein [Cyanobacteria bacterium UBA9226]
MEPIELMEPMLPAEGVRSLDDLVAELIDKASALNGQVKPLLADRIGLQLEAKAHIELEPSQLLSRIELYVEEEIWAGRLLKGSFPLLREALLADSLERARAAAITGYKERQARSVLNHLVKAGLLVSDTPKGAVRLGFPIDVVERYFPKLYPAMG